MCLITTKPVQMCQKTAPKPEEDKYIMDLHAWEGKLVHPDRWEYVNGQIPRGTSQTLAGVLDRVHARWTSVSSVK